MALIVETGAGLSNAESYASAAEADARQLALGNDTWATITTAQKEEALRRATEFLTNSYRMLWKGYRATTTQALDWPRSLAPKPDRINDYVEYYLTTELPIEIKNSCIDLALKAAAGDLMPDVERQTLREKVGPLEVEYMPGAVNTSYSAVMARLAPFLEAGAGGMTARLVRT